MRWIIGQFKEVGYGFFLGAALGMFAGMTYYQWQFYAIIIPVVILVTWKSS
jgi:uncharacterized membrane protein YoaK (UPF0700 family)